ncbi:DUF4357 domain-containing protein [Planctomicrobium sp. SH527]|uniref:DUF4357 domain-containing protein n=1 Tax=Planctomicrobium sp. SH527 TaxID=3448123 RepID=UPI003F5BD481
MQSESPMVFEINAKGCHAQGQLSADGFLVLSGAVIRKDIVPSAPSNLIPQRQNLLSQGILAEQDGQLRLMKDHLFSSPCAAASMVTGTGGNARSVWVTPDGRNLLQLLNESGRNTTSSELKIRTQILQKHNELLADGKLLTKAQLEQYFLVFRERFSPEKLQAVQGEQLLELMHDHGNRDSLVYWLEFKNDDEFPSQKFGGIGGGSAMKFGVFRRKESGIWQGPNDKSKPEDISTQAAIEIAERHRDQLVLGAKLLSELPDGKTDEDYLQLQKQMDELLPDIVGTGWAHKYFSLLFPEKIDDYHSNQWQKYAILKLQQMPPEGEGRYLAAGRFVRAAQQAGLPMNHFTAALNALYGPRHHYWRIAIEDAEQNGDSWSIMRSEGCVGLTWKDVGDLSWVAANKASRDQLREMLGGPESVAAWKKASQLIQFVGKISRNDIIVVTETDFVMGIGRVTGDYEFVPDSNVPHRRSVEWLDFSQWQLPTEEDFQSAVSLIQKNTENVLEIERHCQNGVVLPIPTPLPPKTPVPQLTGIPARIQSVLERKGQVILYGPPGTGKTYWAESTALTLAGMAAFGRAFADLNEDEKAAVTGNNGVGGLVRWCCFHPAYGYEDFLEGHRPGVLQGQLTFELRNGIFKQLCHDALASPDRSFFLIIDEINRGDIPRIFGELLTVLEKDKRGKKILLPISQEEFHVPKNVFVIGTMNTADRSISLLDAALRRRFGFIELMPDASVLRDVVISGVPLRAWLEELNARIRQHVGRDARNLQIGHSYLMVAGKPIKDVHALKRTVRDDILPLLEEYCYEDVEALFNILGNGFFDKKHQQLQQDIFEDGQEEQFLQALLEYSPDISTSAEVTLSETEDDGDETIEDAE